MLGWGEKEDKDSSITGERREKVMVGGATFCMKAVLVSVMRDCLIMAKRGGRELTGVMSIRSVRGFVQIQLRTKENLLKGNSVLRVGELLRLRVGWRKDVEANVEGEKEKRQEKKQSVLSENLEFASTLSTSQSSSFYLQPSPRSHPQASQFVGKVRQ